VAVGRVIAIANQKGGVGKTTTAINLGAGLAIAGHSTVVIDCDPQANSTGGLGFGRDPARRSLYHVLLLGAAASDLVLATCVERLWLIPSEKNLVGANLELSEVPSREHVLKGKIGPLRDLHEFVILDCPPALDILTLNALVAADSVVVPVQCEYFALEGVSELVDTLARVRRTHNPKLAIEGILLTMFDERTNLSHQVRDDLENFFGNRVFKTVIPRNVRLAEAPSHGQPIFVYDPGCRGAESYSQLAEEVISHDSQGVGQGPQRADSGA
jgi:chromosome partitioning protein